MFKDLDEMMAFSKQQALEREAERVRNSPYEINRYTTGDGSGVIFMSLEGELVYYADYIDKIERLKAIHAEELRKAYRMGRDDGVESTVPNWRL